MNIQLLVAISFILIIVLSSFLATYIKNKRIKSVFRGFAAKYGLQFTFESFIFKRYPIIRGQFKNYHLHIYIKSNKGLDESDKFYHSLAELQTELNLENFSIYSESAFRKIWKVFGGQDLKSGNKRLDEKYIFRAANEYEFFQKLSPKVIELLMNGPFADSIIFENGKFTCKVKRIISKHKQMNEIENMLEICLAFLDNESRT